MFDVSQKYVLLSQKFSLTNSLTQTPSHKCSHAYHNPRPQLHTAMQFFAAIIIAVISLVGSLHVVNAANATANTAAAAAAPVLDTAGKTIDLFKVRALIHAFTHIIA